MLGVPGGEAEVGSWQGSTGSTRYIAYPPAGDRRIDDFAIDAYGAEKRALGGYYYLEEKLKFPFRARCDAVRSVSPLKKGELVEVLSLAREDDCMREPSALIEFAGRKLGVPLAQLVPVGANAATREAVEDWRYWVAMGYEF